MEEKWKKCARRQNYEVSSMGNIRNIKTGRILKTFINHNGYKVVSLHENCIPYSERVHRLVAETFIEGGGPDLDVNHKDGDKQNNNVENLEWCTRKENLEHAYETGLKRRPNKIKIRVIETGEVFDSILECSRVMNCDRNQIHRCLIGKEKTCKGYHFEYV